MRKAPGWGAFSFRDLDFAFFRLEVVVAGEVHHELVGQRLQDAQAQVDHDPAHAIDHDGKHIGRIGEVVTGTAGGPELCHYAGEPLRPIAGAESATAFGNAMNYELSDASCHGFFTTGRPSLGRIFGVIKHAPCAANCI